jgi:predicted methyltransferase
MNPFPMNNAVEILWHLIPRFLSAGDTCVDATVGNGKDTAALCRVVGPEGHVYGFDIQEEALNHARAHLEDTAPESSFTLIHASHSMIGTHICALVDLVLFNLGYLPGGDKSITTEAESTIEAMTASLALLKAGGKLAAVLYPGHKPGAREAEAVKNWASKLSQKEFSVIELTFTNQVNNPPQLILIEKRG